MEAAGVLPRDSRPLAPGWPFRSDRPGCGTVVETVRFWSSVEFTPKRLLYEDLRFTLCGRDSRHIAEFADILLPLCLDIYVAECEVLERSLPSAHGYTRRLRLLHETVVVMYVNIFGAELSLMTGLAIRLTQEKLLTESINWSPGA